MSQGTLFIVSAPSGAGKTSLVRELIESLDGAGNRWFTVGVSPNIVDASFQALTDSIVYKLIRDGAPGPAKMGAKGTVTMAQI